MAMPKEVAMVRDAMQANATRGLKPIIAKKAVWCRQESDGTWALSDNFERFSDLILEYKNGQWSTRHMYGDAEPEEISLGEALANANLFFADK